MTIRKVRHIPVVKDMILPDPLRLLNIETNELLTEAKEQRTMKKTTTKKTNKKSKAKSTAKAAGKKTCRDCQKSQAVSKFGKNSALEDGLHSRCKVCESSYRDSLSSSKPKKASMKKVAKKVMKKTAKKKK